jgi:nucleoside phosphorylase/NTP pyrophosphatase (non-canonical NTP hydrolase)
MTTQPLTPRATYSLDDLYLMVASIYTEQNAHRSPSATFAHFVEVCGMLTVHDRKKKREDFDVEDALCKALGWFFPLLAKFKVKSVESLIFRKYPYACPYCRRCPHKDAACKTTLGTKRTVDHAAVKALHAENSEKRPRGLNAWQQMFDDIYPRETAALDTARSTTGLLEELGELAEAVRVYEKYPKYFAGEAADVFSYLMGFANEHRVRLQLDSLPEFDFEAAFLRRYPGLCPQCGHTVCICPSVPESTVGRMAKELDLASTSELFSLDPPFAEARGKAIGASVLQELGGLPAIARQLPLDRGEANRAMVLLCLHLSDEVQSKNNELATNLRAAAFRIAAEAQAAGSRAQGESSFAVVAVLSSVWPLLKLAVLPEDDSLQVRLGKLLRAQAVRIGIVTALPKEFAAMRVMLEEQQTNPVAGDPNDYTIGTIPALDGSGSHIVAVTLLKDMGNNSASAAASHLLRSFSTIEDVLMVGIAGGVPFPDRPQEHVRLGDVVVSDKHGVVQYDNLKIGSEKTILRSSPSKPSARMVGAVRIMESERILGRYPWEDLLSRSARLEGGTRPPEATDILHTLRGGTSIQIDHPADPTRRPGQPKIHYGAIGAANVLLKDPVLRDKLKQDCGVIAIEMEGSGIADAIWTAGQQYLIIRGICDYCDDNKNDTWQGYAAVAAAAYARTLIASISLSAHKNK